MRLFKHQTEALSKALYQDSFAFFMDMGLGKTLTALMWIKMRSFYKVLLILRRDDFLTWRNDNNKFTHFSIQEIEGSIDKRKELLKNSTARLNFITYDSIKSVKQVLMHIPFDAVLCDESSKIKHFSDRFKITYKATRHIPYRAILTGTPTTNSIEDLITQIKFLDDGKRLGDSAYWFRKKFCETTYPFGFIFLEENLPKIKKLISDISYTQYADNCIDLPPERFVIKEAILTSKQNKYYNEVLEDWEVDMGDKKILMEYVISKLSKLQQISSGFLYDDEYVYNFKSGKEEIFFNLMNDDLKDKKKIVVWCAFDEEIRLITEMIDRNFKDSYVTYDSKTIDREKARIDFKNNPDIKFFIGKVQMGMGMNELVVADTDIFYSNSYSLEHRLQAQKRIRRIGSEQHKSILHIDIVSKGTKDEDILECLKANKNILDEIMDGKITLERENK